jgi:hypothetical protein
MNAKQLFTIATLSFAATAVLADDVTMVRDSFVRRCRRTGAGGLRT